MEFRVLGFRVYELFRVYYGGSGFRVEVQGLGFRASGFTVGFTVWGLGFMV